MVTSPLFALTIARGTGHSAPRSTAPLYAQGISAALLELPRPAAKPWLTGSDTPVLLRAKSAPMPWRIMGKEEDIKGNSYRLVVKIEYRLGIMFVKHVLTHAEYDKGDWKK